MGGPGHSPVLDGVRGDVGIRVHVRSAEVAAMVRPLVPDLSRTKTQDIKVRSSLARVAAGPVEVVVLVVGEVGRKVCGSPFYMPGAERTPRWACFSGEKPLELRSVGGLFRSVAAGGNGSCLASFLREVEK